MKAVYLESRRLYFEPLSKKHLSDNYLSWLNDNEVNKYLEVSGDYTVEMLQNFVETQEKKDILFWAIHIKSSNKHIGNIKIDPIDIDNKSGEYGIMMGDKKEWGKGYAKEASKAIIDYCFNILNLSQITLGVIETNATAVNLYEKLGFSLYNRIKNYGIYDNSNSDSLRMIKINDK